MAKKDFHIGPGAASLLLVAVVVSMGVLGMLAMMNVHSDIRLTTRSEALIEAQYDASVTAEEQLSSLDDVVVIAALQYSDETAFLAYMGEHLPEGMTIEGDLVSWDVPVGDTSVLHCTVRVSGKRTADRISWVTHSYESFVTDEE